MTKRPVIAVAALLILAAGCGQEGTIIPDLTAGRGTPAPGATNAPEASPGATTAADATATPAAGQATSAPTTAPQAQTTKPAAEGGVNAPKDGSYVYTYSGESDDPFNPTAPPQKFDGELTVDISHQGNVYTSEQTNTETPGRFTTRTRWEADRILLLSFKTETSGGDFSCTFDPPLLIAKIPIRPETFPTQNFKGTGNACQGKLDITVEGQETVKDATGRSWETWRARIRLQAGNEQFTNTTDQKQWLSPELGVEVRTDGTSHGEIRTAGGSQTFDGKAASALKRHP